MQKVICLLATLLAIFATHSTANACSCIAPGPIAEAFTSEDLVFTGRVIDKKLVNHSHGNGVYVYTFKVIKTYKGEPGKIIKVESAENSAMCGYDMAVGEKHLLWIGPRQDTQQGQVGNYHVNICSRSSLLANAGEQIDWLEKNRCEN